MPNVSSVITIAKSEIGYTEKKGNITKYARFFDEELPDFYNTKKQGAEWCDIFVDWCFVHAYGNTTGRKMLYQPLKSCGAGCSFSYNYFKTKGRTGTTPRKGAQIFFKNSKGTICHTGIVIDVNKTHVFTIEGNKDNSVKECKYPIKSTKIYGYGYPDYDIDTAADQEKPKEDPKPATPAKSYKVVVIAKSGLNVRKEPNTKCKVITVLPYKTIVTVTDYNNDWLKYRDWYISKKWCEKINFSDKY